MKCYMCDICKKLFDTPKTLNTSYEDYYGADVIGCKTQLSLEVCPYCDSEEIEEKEETYDE